MGTKLSSGLAFNCRHEEGMRVAADRAFVAFLTPLQQRQTKTRGSFG
jgi:hypothetical protein